MIGTRDLHRAATAVLVVALVGACGGTAAPPTAAPPSAAGPTARPVTATATPSADADLGGTIPNPTATAIPHTPRTTASPPPATHAPPPAEPSLTPTALAPAPSPPPAEPFAINLYEPGDFVAQYTFEWCVGASIQMTLAMTDTSHDMSRERQQQLWETARDTSFSPFGGANPNGWVATLNRLGVGPYEMVSEPTLEAALRRAARAIVETSRPVGLVMWRGRHAWMMSGFQSLGDPRTQPDFTVTGVNVLDPLYPHGSRRWGPSPEPNALVTPDVLGAQFVARTGGRVKLPVAPGYVLILPASAA